MLGFFKRILKSRQKKGGIFFVGLKRFLGARPKDLALYREALGPRASELEGQKALQASCSAAQNLGRKVIDMELTADLSNFFEVSDLDKVGALRSYIFNPQRLAGFFEALKRYGLIAEDRMEHCEERVLIALFEAFVAAVYSDLGAVRCRRFLFARAMRRYMGIGDLREVLPPLHGLKPRTDQGG